MCPEFHYSFTAKMHLKLKSKEGHSLPGHALCHLLQKAKHPNIESVSSSGRDLCNGLRASRKAPERPSDDNPQVDYHQDNQSSRKCFMSLLVFVK